MSAKDSADGRTMTYTYLSLFDFGARYYDAYVGRWNAIDPLAHKYFGMSPYNYCGNNPVNKVDPDGCLAGDYYNMLGNYIGTDGIDDGKNYLVLDYKEEKDIKKTNRAGGTTPTNEVKTAVSVPSDAVVSKMEEAYDITEENGLEHGFRVGQKHKTSLAEGTDKNVYLTGPENELLEKGEYATIEAHTHPKGNLVPMFEI